MKRSCSTCYYGIRYVDGKGETIYYECRFNPPALYFYPMYTNTPAIFNQCIVYPRLQEHDWCFKYKVRK